jgi:hypothetical protein
MSLQLRERPTPTEALDRIAEQFRTRTGVAHPEDPEARVELEVPELLDLPEVEPVATPSAKSKK